MDIDLELKKILGQLVSSGADKDEMAFWDNFLPSLNDGEKKEILDNFKLQLAKIKGE